MTTAATPTQDSAVGRVVTVGETMVLIVPSSSGRLRHATDVALSIAGAESNVAIGLSRLGSRRAGSALGDDGPGELVLHRVRARGADANGQRDADMRTW